ncbi:MAG: beta-ketoacyl-ACP synthase I, partial [Oleibacter sp.]|nr:beta-ketoacyl-ACP synthase I [Thalassolituus sp.]
GTSTPAGDICELNAIRRAFADDLPFISSTKSLSGHSLGAAGVHEAIYSLLMLKHGFIAGTANLNQLDDGAAGVEKIVSKSFDHKIRTVMSNSFGFGGTNAALIFQKFDG